MIDVSISPSAARAKMIGTNRPMSELYGRKIPLFLGYTIFAIFQIPVAVATNIQSVMIFVSFIRALGFEDEHKVAERLQRFLQGFFGAAPVGIIAGALADIWNPRQVSEVATLPQHMLTCSIRERGFSMPFFAGTLFIGPIFGPIIGTYLSDSYLGWRW